MDQRFQDSDSQDWRPGAKYTELLSLADEQVMEELRAGNADAFAVIFRRYHRLIHSTALSILRDAGEAEDLTQSVFLEVYRKVGQFDPAKGSLKVWLLQFAYSRSINRRNYLVVRQHHNQTDLAALDDVGSLWSLNRLTQQETVRLSSEVLARLPEEQRRTLEMFFFEGLTFKEIAERTKESFSNVRHQYYRGLERVRNELHDRRAQTKARTVAVSLGEIQRAET